MRKDTQLTVERREESGVRFNMNTLMIKLMSNSSSRLVKWKVLRSLSSGKVDEPSDEPPKVEANEVKEGSCIIIILLLEENCVHKLQSLQNESLEM